MMRKETGQGKIAAEIMTWPVKYILCDSNLKEGKIVFNHYNINVMPVLDNQKNLVGFITRKIIDKALYHGIKEGLVKEFMISDPLTVTLNTRIDKIQKYMIDTNQGFLPVIKNRKVVGIITKTDLLWALRDTTAQSASKNLSHLIQKILPEQVTKLLRTVGQIGDDLSYSVFVVGGLVRDLLLGFENRDIDIVTEGDGIRLAKIVHEKLGGILTLHKRFNTASISFPDKVRIDIATARWEYYKNPGAFPSIEPASIKHDQGRRDFTINALFIKLNQHYFGEFIDFLGGERDLKNKKIRVIHNLSFIEDPTRVYRAIRFEQRLHFQIEKHTKALIAMSVRRNFLARIKGSRLYLELVALFNEPDPGKVIHRMHELDVLKSIHHSIGYGTGLKNLLIQIKKSIIWYKRIRSENGNNVEEWIPYFLALMDNASLEELKALCGRLWLSKSFRNRITKDRIESNNILNSGLLSRLKKTRDSDICEQISNVSTEALLYLMAKTNLF